MTGTSPIVAIVPALDEQATIAGVVCGLRAAGAHVLVVDNGSRDRTAEMARASGAAVVREPRRGYGAAAWAGLSALDGEETIAVFASGDGSDDPGDLAAVVGPVAAGRADLVVGSRVLGTAEPGSLTPAQRFGNRLATFILARLFDRRLTDLGPFRAARLSTLRSLGLRDRGFGWTVEMEARALALRLRVVEVPVRWRRRRGGRPKISGTVLGSLRAGLAILAVLGRVALARRPPAR